MTDRYAESENLETAASDKDRAVAADEEVMGLEGAEAVTDEDSGDESRSSAGRDAGALGSVLTDGIFDDDGGAARAVDNRGRAFRLFVLGRVRRDRDGPGDPRRGRQASEDRHGQLPARPESATAAIWEPESIPTTDDGASGPSPDFVPTDPLFANQLAPAQHQCRPVRHQCRGRLGRLTPAMAWTSP